MRQTANTRDLIFDVPRLIEFASSFYTLYPGDIYFTGTPAGVGPVKPGDVLRARCAASASWRSRRGRTKSARNARRVRQNEAGE